MLEGGELLLELHVDVEGTVEETASGASRPALVKSAMGRVDDPLIISQARIRIRPEHKNLMPIDVGDLRTLFACNFPKIRIYTSLHEFLRLAVILIPFL